MTAAVQRQATVWQEQLTAAVAQPTTAATAASAAAPVATSAPTPTVEATPALSAAAAPVAPVTDATADAVAQPTPTVEAPSLLGLLPTPTPGVEPPAAAVPVEPTPAPPAPVTATVLLGANLRSGPSTDFGIVGAAQQGEAVTLVGRNADSTWFQTAAGAWIFGQLLENVPTDLPVVETPALPAAPAAEPPAQQG
jgi:uncharacterized protein YgiM (DUF1202 family)